MMEPARGTPPPMLNQPEPACLVIADITGYTGFLAGAELDHAQDILADLMGTVVGAFRPTFKLAKLEGDAAFVYVDHRDGRRAAAPGHDRAHATSRSGAGSATSARRRRASATPASASRTSTSRSSPITARSSASGSPAARSSSGAT